MRHRLFYASGLLALATLVLVARPAAAQTTANGPYYATPAWDQTLACTTLATCPRFIVLSNMGSAAVLDRETGLVWERSPGDTNNDGIVDVNDIRSWTLATSHCANTSVGGRKGWRLASFAELASLVDPNNPGGNPDLAPGHPFINIRSAEYWSATTDAADPTVAWFVSFSSGTVHTGGADRFVWCVRGGMNAAAY